MMGGAGGARGQEEGLVGPLLGKKAGWLVERRVYYSERWETGGLDGDMDGRLRQRNVLQLLVQYLEVVQEAGRSEDV